MKTVYVGIETLYLLTEYKFLMIFSNLLIYQYPINTKRKTLQKNECKLSNESSHEKQITNENAGHFSHEKQRTNVNSDHFQGVFMHCCHIQVMFIN